MSSKRFFVILLKPEYAKAIYDGRKTWEFRKVPPPLCRWLAIYESAPVSAITGQIVFSASMTAYGASAILRMVKSLRGRAGVSEKALAAYAGDKKITAILVRRAIRWNAPLKLFPRPPQNWGSYLVNPTQGNLLATPSHGILKSHS